MYFIRNIEDLEDKSVESHKIEYEVSTDGYTVGECNFGPYYFSIWEISYKKEGEERKLCLRIKEKGYSQDDSSWKFADKEAFYHEGDIADEILALSSLFLRRRFKRGPKVRWNDEPRLFLKPEEWIDKPLITGKRKLTDLPYWLELVNGLDDNLHQKFILAVRLYYHAILFLEEQPDMAYLNLVSSIETLCREQNIGKVELRDLDVRLATLVDNIGNNDLKGKIERAILKREKLLMFSCKTRGFCPSCHAKRREEWGEWMREELILDAPHRQVVFTIPKMLRIFFKYSGGTMRIISFIEDYKVIDKIIDHLKLTFKAERPPPAQAQLSMAAEERSEYI